MAGPTTGNSEVLLNLIENLWSSVFEVLFPGASPAWGPLAGLALVAWISLLMHGLLIYKIGSPYVLSSIAMPNASGAYELPPADPSSVFQTLNPG